MIGKMPFLWLSIEDDAAKESLRGISNRLSNYNKPCLDRLRRAGSAITPTESA